MLRIYCDILQRGGELRTHHAILRVLDDLAVESRGGATVSHHRGVVLTQKYRLRPNQPSQMFSEISNILKLSEAKNISPLMVLTSSFRVSVMSSLQTDV